MDEMILFRAAAEETWERIDADIGCVPVMLRPVLVHLRRDLFIEGFGVTDLRTSFSGELPELRERFRDVLGMPPTKYITEARLETAARLLRDSSISVGKIALLVGYSDISAFRSTFRRVFRSRPLEVRKLSLKLPKLHHTDFLSVGLWRQFERGEIKPGQGRVLANWLRKLYGFPHPRSSPTLGQTSAGLRRRVAELFFETFLQKQALRHWRDLLFQDPFFGGPEFIDLLGRKSMEAGRKDREQGLELAQLAVELVEIHAAAW
jgi:AraC-like DNA-binding protein